MKSREFMVH